MWCNSLSLQFWPVIPKMWNIWIPADTWEIKTCLNKVLVYEPPEHLYALFYSLYKSLYWRVNTILQNKVLFLIWCFNDSSRKHWLTCHSIKETIAYFTVIVKWKPIQLADSCGIDYLYMCNVWCLGSDLVALHQVQQGEWGVMLTHMGKADSDLTGLLKCYMNRSSSSSKWQHSIQMSGVAAKSEQSTDGLSMLPWLKGCIGYMLNSRVELAACLQVLLHVPPILVILKFSDKGKD